MSSVYTTHGGVRLCFGSIFARKSGGKSGQRNTGCLMKIREERSAMGDLTV